MQAVAEIVFASTPEWVGDIAVWMGLLVTACSLAAFTYGFTKFAVRLFRGVVIEVVDERLEPVLSYQSVMTGRVDGLVGAIDDIQAQLHPNAGTSMRDQVNKIGAALGVERQDSHPPSSGLHDNGGG